jgi:hypothetical protein
MKPSVLPWPIFLVPTIPPFILKALDGAPATTVDDLDIYVLVKGAVAHALVFRVVGRYEEATPEPNITPELASLAEKRMTGI